MPTILFVRGSGRFPAKPQYEAAEKYKPESILDVSKGDGLDDLFAIARKDSVVLLHGIGRLEMTWAGFRVAINRLWKSGAHVLDTRTGQVVTSAALQSMTEAHAELVGMARLPGRAPKVRGKKGGLARSALQTTELSMEQCRAIWFDKKKYDRDLDAEEATGVRKRTLYNWFGASGRRPGKRPK